MVHTTTLQSLQKTVATVKKLLEQDIVVYKALIKARSALAELKGIANTMPNPAILINTLSLQEAQDSSSIENIITTQDEIFKYYLNPKSNKNIATKEVAHYAQATNFLFKELKQNGFISINMLVEAQKKIQQNNAGIRNQSGTNLMNEQTKEVIYTPPSPLQLPDLLTELERFINVVEDDFDPIIRMAIIHLQFECIHPFFDGNGRVGRILNIIYLIHSGLLESPILYLSRYINQNKAAYYQLLQSVRLTNNWGQWLIYMINGVTKTAESTMQLVKDIQIQQQNFKHQIKAKMPKMYSHELLNSLFKHPYTKVAFVQEDLSVSRLTANRYLNALVEANLLSKQKIGRNHFYFNPTLIKRLALIEDMKN